MKNKSAILSGNEAIARGAYEGGVSVAAGYPGTPSSEILETLTQYGGQIYCEWAPNEKVAVEVAAGASLVGARSMATMKHVGLNVASDPLMTLSYLGTEGSLVVAVADDPGMYSSQNEQDTRNYARSAKVPMFEPSDSQEAKDFMIAALELSEEFATPVILRSSTRISHGKSVVRLGERKISPRKIGFVKNPQRYVAVPRYARKMREKMEERLRELRFYVNKCSQNRVIKGGKDIGVVTSGIAFQYAMEEFKEASILKLGLSYPFPDDLIREFASHYKELIIVEELDNFLEEHIRSLGIKTKGKDYFPWIGELNPDRVARGRRRIEKGSARPVEKAMDEDAALIPPRPPVFCPGCPSRGLFYALSRIDCVVTGDIGCYSLGVFPPYERMDTILCMGGGITVAQGMDKAGFRDKPLIGIVGDSTFFHSGITGLLELSYNKGISTIVIVDNRATAMTGLQDHPGTGRTLMKEETYTAYPEDFARACGIKNIRVISPLDLGETLRVLKEEVKKEAASVIISRHPCVLLQKPKKGPWSIEPDRCNQCARCLKIGCPAIYKQRADEEVIMIDETLCRGCGFCGQVCPKEAIVPGG
ncbi:indolepyruvate ferredoxin oxidoreductase subunit alpha [Candidatus Aerophobetes bacterium]|uniref:Indolepyruvate oxidoreductase subunit IorA n=1 Tax=Aerophobetes bacterium TaxID=2030807 RepID=A0A523VVD8_UNCAE|nr:MAG: indolepyruvate ferredoxin oxidoreductase subunit alpha [Candidatus Aerophobetes bacterium]